MIELSKDIKPSEKVLKDLQKLQDMVDAEPTFSAKSEKAQKLFKAKNTKTNVTFREVKKCFF